MYKNKLKFLPLSFLLIMVMSHIAFGSLELSISSNQTEYLKGLPIKITVKLFNNGEKDCEITTTSKEPPFSISVWNEAGYDLNENNRKILTKRSNKNLLTRAKTSTNYSYVLQEVISSLESKTVITQGVYIIEATLPVVTQINNKYKVNLLKSNKFKIIINEK